VNTTNTQHRSPPSTAATQKPQPSSGVFVKASPSPPREERVHAFSPEERAEIQSIVRSTVDRAIAPILDMQRKLQQRLDAERAQPAAPPPPVAIAPPPPPVAVAPPPPPVAIAPPPTPVAVAPPPTPVAAAPPPPVAAAPRPPPVATAATEAVFEIPVFVDEPLEADPPTDLDDLELRWSGDRRRRLLALTFAAIAALAVAATTVAVMLSQAGFKL
jgi:hypothetical protein